MNPRIDPEVDAVLRECLAEDQGLLPFARAVVVHLSNPPARPRSQAEVAARVIEALDADGDPETGPPAPGWTNDPELLASFFQNADLLDPRHAGTGRIAHRVMEALERIRGLP